MTFLAGAILTFASLTAAEAAGMEKPVTVWKKGMNDYHTYRIPSLLVAPDGSLLAFCEGRKNNMRDAGDIDLVVKRSTDGGRHWSDQEVIWDEGPNTCGNPCPVVDQSTGRIWLLLTHNLGADHEGKIKTGTAKGTRTVWVCHSDDSGKSWSEPVEITKSTKDPGWGWYATGPGVGIQVEHGSHKGRLVIPCDHSFDTTPGSAEVKPGFGSHAIYSDDHGKTWRLGAPIQPAMNECQVVELADGQGTLQMNMRSYAKKSSRGVATSEDGGQTWGPIRHDKTLVEPVCQASIIRYDWPKGENPGRLLFSNPAHPKKRVGLTLRASEDDGRTWPKELVVDPGHAAYSCLAKLPDGTIGCLYEGGQKPYEEIRFVRIPIESLESRGAGSR
ncbi:Sialidase precursor [Planctomycetes bacterium Pan216]|uniref:exo-alpha-sialidase n=1 Tax=Kolteria novifilia TaxID=2527975 RepID=A0A518B0A8_9BACT|nr:Sialidase precursor [Planctomycetes bacterium Pan216]